MQILVVWPIASKANPKDPFENLVFEWLNKKGLSEIDARLCKTLCWKETNTNWM